jgi:broad specificity phosphatase PhoE
MGLTMRLVTLLLLALLVACASVPLPEPVPAYYVMRHLHTPEGLHDPDLTEEGRRVAALLPPQFVRHPPRAIYVTQWKRTQQTAAPLAERLGITPTVYDAGDSPALAARLRSEAGPVLIVGHSNTVPDIVEHLGGQRPGPLEHHDFGDLWIIAADGGTRRKSLGGH